MKLFIALSFAGAVIAQTSSISSPVPSSITMVGAGGGAGVSGVMGQIVSANGVPMNGISVSSVQGQPYSADRVTEHVQTLADGTHITQPGQRMRVYRDSQGRTRTETTARVPPGLLGKGGDPPIMIEISDPVGGVRYSLESRSHIAHKSVMHVRPLPPPLAPALPAPVRVTRGAVPVQAAIVSTDNTAHPQISRESLGTRTIEGVLAEGVRITTVFPLDAIGNDRPITVTSETWTSPDLQALILQKSSDPRSGDSTTRLTNILRAEPDPALFQVPADYAIEDPQSAVPKQ